MKPRRKHLLLAILLVLVATLSGCLTATWSPEAKHVAARDTFNATVKALTAAIDAGQFTDAEALKILELAQAGRKALNAWEDAVTSDTPPADQIARYEAILADLSAFQ